MLIVYIYVYMYTCMHAWIYTYNIHACMHTQYQVGTKNTIMQVTYFGVIKNVIVHMQL